MSFRFRYHIQVEVFWVVTLKMEAARSSETLVSYCSTTHHHNSEHDLNLHHHDNLKSCISYQAL